MPFGLNNAPPTLQRAIDAIIANIPNALVYVDDVIIYSKSIEEHLKHLEKIFETLSKHNFVIQSD